jgi:hypothetical protein
MPGLTLRRAKIGAFIQDGGRLLAALVWLGAVSKIFSAPSALSGAMKSRLMSARLEFVLPLRDHTNNLSICPRDPVGRSLAVAPIHA